MEDSIHTPEQVAQILQVHPFTVLKFIKQGRLKASKLGRVYRIRKSDVDLFLDEQARESEEAMQRRKASLQEKKESAKQTESNTAETSVPKKKKIGTVTKSFDAAAVPEKSTTMQTEPPSGAEVSEQVVRSEENDIDHYILEFKQEI